MKKARLTICIILCMILCVNLMPVYGSDTAEPEITDTITEITEEIETEDPDDDIPEEPEIMPLTPPAGVKAELTPEGYVKVTWNKVFGAAEYEVYRCLYRNGQYKYGKSNS